MIETTARSAHSEESAFLRVARCTLWSGEGVTLGRFLVAGALVWFLYGVLVVLVHGVTLDQDLVPAQVIAGAVRYPPGHPHEIFYHSLFNLPSYFLAWLWALTPSPMLISALRNYVFIFLSAFVPFSMTAVLTRRPGWGYIAATLSLSQAANAFHGTYPIMFYPDFDSDGHIGQHLAVLIVALLLGSVWRWGGFFLGLLPAIHPTMAAIVWPWSVCYFYMAARRTAAGEKRRTLLAIGGGLAVCGALACLIFLSVPNSGSPPPYDSHANGGLIYRLFETTSDVHRRPLPLSLPGYVIHPVALFAMIAVLFWKPRSDSGVKPGRETLLGLLVLGVFVWAYVCLGSAFIHSSYGWLAQWVRITMPGRFSNLTALMIIPLSVALAARSDRAPIIFTVLLLLQAVVAPIDGDFLRMNLLFVILGAAFATDAYLRWDGPARGKALLAPGILAGASAVLYFARAEKGIFGLCVGFLIAAAVLYARRMTLPGWSIQISVLLAMALCLSIPMKQDPGVRITAYDRQLNAWLAEHAAPGESILTPMGPAPELQVKTGHPVLMERESLVLMTYKPALAPVLGAMARDLYGVDYSDPSQLERLMTGGRISLGSTVVLKQWQSIPADKWRSLGHKYNFRLVLSLTTAPLDLTAVLPGKEWTLYSIE